MLDIHTPLFFSSPQKKPRRLPRKEGGHFVTFATLAKVQKSLFPLLLLFGPFSPFFASHAQMRNGANPLLFSLHPSFGPCQEKSPGKNTQKLSQTNGFKPCDEKRIRQSGNSAFSSSSFDLRDLFGMSSKRKAQKSLSPLPTSPPLFNLPSPPFPTAAPFKKRLKRPRKCPFPSPSSFDQCRWCLRSLLTWVGGLPCQKSDPPP